MKAVAETLGVARSNLIDRLQGRTKPRRRYQKAQDAAVVPRITALVAVRVVWGFIGPRHARFADFFPTPRRVEHHVRALLGGSSEHHWGHNPLGALMVFALLAMVLSLGLTGWMQTLDAFWGAEWLMDLHEGLGEWLMPMVGLHAVATIVMGRIERTRLVKAMVTGVKERY